MNPTRARVIGLAATLTSLPFLFPAAASAHGNGTPGITLPPTPGACHGYLWTQDVTSPDAQVLSKDHPWIKIDGLTIPAGHVEVTNAITWDSRTGTDHTDGDDQDGDNQDGDNQGENLVAGPTTTVADSSTAAHDDDTGDTGDTGDKYTDADPELYEMMRVDFWANGDHIANTPEHTPDLADDTRFPSVVADLGGTDLTQPADAVYLKHSSMFMNTDGKENLFYPVSVCITWDAWTAAPAATVTEDCNTASLTLTNTGKLASELAVTVNGTSESVSVAPDATVHRSIPLTEDTTTAISVRDGDKVLLEKTINTNCVADTTTTVPPVTTAPPTTAAVATTPVVTTTPVADTAVLAETETAPQLAFTGSDTALKGGIGAALLGFGAAMLGLSRRRRRGEA